MYNQLKWADRVTEFENRYRESTNPDGSITHTPDEGAVIQVGTPQNQVNFNNMESGIQDVTIAAQILAVAMYRNQLLDEAHQALMDGEVLGEVHEVTLKNTLTPPFNSSVDAPTSVALTQVRKAVTATVHELSSGCKGAEVKNLQRVLYARNIRDNAGKAIAVDGDFGACTKQAVIKLQTLFPGDSSQWDGLVGAETWAAMLTKLW